MNYSLKKDNKMNELKGLGTALATPFSGGRVDYDSYVKLVTRQVSKGVDFLVPLGTTAETPCLDDDEKVELLKLTRELCDKPVIAGCGTNSLAGTLRNIKLLEPCGPDAFLVVTPYYNKPTQEGLYQYFKAVAECAGKPIVLYNVPSRTGVNMKAETTLRLAAIPNIIAVKEASGDLNQVLEIKRKAPKGFSVLSGNDDQTFPLMAGGADGIISVVSNIEPMLMSSLVRALQAGKIERARELNDRLIPLYKACFVESNPIAVKGGLSVMGLCRNECRLPLTPATSQTLALMKEIIKDL